MGAFLAPLLGLGSSLIGGLFQNSANNARNDLINQWANQLFGQSQFGVNKADFPYSLAGQLFGNLAGQNNGLTPQLQELLSAIQGQQGNIPGLMNNQEIDPGVQQRLSDFLFTQGNIQGSQNPLQQLENIGGATPASQDLYKLALHPIEGNPTLTNTGEFLLGNSGQTGNIQMLQQIASGLLGTGGFTNALDQGIGNANNIIANNGLFPGMGQGLNAFQTILNNGGATPLSSEMGQRGMDLFNQNPLLSNTQAMSLARDQAATANLQQEKQALAQATARNMDGAVNTGGDQALKDVSEAAARNEASAIANSLFNQQGLGLQQQALGANAVGQAGGLNNSRLNIGAGGLTNLTGLASNNVIQALKTISDLTSAATGRMSVGGNLGLGSEQAATNNMGLAANMIQNSIGNTLQGQNLAANILNLQQNGLLGSGSVLNNLYGTENQSTNDALQGYLNNAGLNLNRGSSTAGNILSLLGLQGNIGQSGLQGYLNAASGLSGIGQGYLGYGSNALGGIAGLIGQYGGGSPIGNVLMNGGLGVMAGGMNNIFGGGNSGNGGGIYAGGTYLGE